MAPTGTRQRLAAILAADVAGYSRLMAHDELATVAALDASRQVFRDATQTHNGRVIDMAGDSVLAIFETAAGAVQAAIEVQRTLDTLAEGVPADRRMRFRIGVHLGDVIVKDDGSVYGDGVNIAARLESLALPGGITVSDAVRGSVRNRVPGSFEDLGDQRVKNISDPVRVFKLVPSGALSSRGETSPDPSAQRTRKLRWVAGSAVVVLAVAGLALFRELDLGTIQATGEPPLLSIAILPFTLANASATDSLANDFTRQATHGLSATLLGQSVISADAVMVHGGSPSDLRGVAKELNVRYLLVGEIRREDYQLFVTVQLIEAQTRIEIWTQQVRTTRNDAPEVAVRQVVNSLRSALYKAEAARLPQQPSSHATPLELVFRAVYKPSGVAGPEGVEQALRLCDTALKLNPALAAAFWCRARLLGQLIASTDPDDLVTIRRRVADMDESTQQMVRIEGEFAPFWDTRADALRWQHRWEAAMAARREAMRLAPFLPEGFRGLAWDHIYTGAPLDAGIFLSMEAQLNPDTVKDEGYMSASCRMHLLRGEYDEVVAQCERATSGGRGDDYASLFLAVAYAEKGETSKAARMRDRARSLVPGLTVAKWKAECAKYTDNARYAELQDRYVVPGMRKAGFPEK